jgi:hypothetical protein
VVKGLKLYPKEPLKPVVGGDRSVMNVRRIPRRKGGKDCGIVPAQCVSARHCTRSHGPAELYVTLPVYSVVSYVKLTSIFLLFLKLHFS